jgi:site-specific DNA-cytosine methylase
MTRVLVACEESQAVTIELRRMGIEAYSCDVLPCSGGHPEWHLQQDVTPLLQEAWDIVIAFPPCTHLAVSGAAWFEEKRKDGRQRAAIDFFMQFARADCPRVAIENPVGIMSGLWKPPTQIVQPWQFGDSFTKTTCLWLKNLPPLRPTEIVEKGELIEFESGRVMPKWYADAWRLPAG